MHGHTQVTLCSCVLMLSSSALRPGQVLFTDVHVPGRFFRPWAVARDHDPGVEQSGLRGEVGLDRIERGRVGGRQESGRGWRDGWTDTAAGGLVSRPGDFPADADLLSPKRNGFTSPQPEVSSQPNHDLHASACVLTHKLHPLLPQRSGERWGLTQLHARFRGFLGGLLPHCRLGLAHDAAGSESSCSEVSAR